MRPVTLWRSWSLGIANNQLSWDQTWRSLKLGQMCLGCHPCPKQEHLSQPQHFAWSGVFNPYCTVHGRNPKHTGKSMGWADPEGSLLNSKSIWPTLLALFSDSHTLPVWLVRIHFRKKEVADQKCRNNSWKLVLLRWKSILFSVWEKLFQPNNIRCSIRWSENMSFWSWQLSL